MGNHIFDDVFQLAGNIIAFKVGDAGRVKGLADDGILALVGEVDIIKQLSGHNDALLLGLLEHVVIPLAEHFILGDELILRVAVEDIVIALGRRTTPDVGSVETTLLDETEVFDKNLVIDSCAEATRLKVVDRVEVRDVDASAVGGWAIMPVLVDVHAKQKDVNAVNLLEQENALCADREVRGTALLLVTLEHLLIWGALCMTSKEDDYGEHI